MTTEPNVLIIHRPTIDWSMAMDTMYLHLDKYNMPNIRKNQAYYVTDSKAERLYHIRGFTCDPDGNLALIIGNSYLPRRRPLLQTTLPFEYLSVTYFGFMEIQPGVLIFLPSTALV